MLEYLYVQNLPNAAGGLDLSKCVSLLRLDATGSSFTAYDFAAGGLLQEAYLQSPTSLTLRDLQYLTDGKLHIGSYSRLSALRLENCPYLDSLAMIHAAANLNRLRMIGVDWTLADISQLKAFSNSDAFGGWDDGGFETVHSVLSGSVNVTGGDVRVSDRKEFGSLWPNLSITYGANVNYINTWLATYVNYNYASAGSAAVLGSVYVDEGSAAPNIGFINSDTLVKSQFAAYGLREPAKAKDQASVYTFSGWSGLSDSVQNDLVITAVFTASPRQYTVSWYAKPDDTAPIYTASGDYGSEFVYDDSTEERNFATGAAYQPELSSEIVDTHIEYTGVRYFTGTWDKCTGCVTDDMSVYGVWKQNGIPAAGTDLEDMTTGDLLAVSLTGSIADYAEIKDRVNVVLGNDMDFTNVRSEVLAEDLRLDGATCVDKNITLFGENSPSFTLALDFRFTDTSAADNTLVSCFDSSGSEGFRLRFSTNPNIQWGDVSGAVGYKGYRDMVVLRYVKGGNQLYVYSSNGTSATFTDDVIVSTLTRSRSTSTGQSLVFGAVKNTDGTFSNYGSGYLYWAKIWYGDIGDSNAKAVAAWPREKLSMMYYGSDIYEVEGTGKKAGASFISNACLADRTRAMNSTDASVWDTCAMNTFMNGRLLKAVPIEWRLLLKKVEVGTTDAGSCLYMPSYQELTGQTNSYDSTLKAGEQISWITSGCNNLKSTIITPGNWWRKSADSSSLAIDVSGRSYLTTIAYVNQKNSSYTTNHYVGFVLVTTDDAAYYGLTIPASPTIASGSDTFQNACLVNCVMWGTRSSGGSGKYYAVKCTGIQSIANDIANVMASNSYSAEVSVCPCFSI